MTIQTTCCVTGHRNLPEHQIPAIRHRLRQEILLAIEDGFHHFISGFANGADLLFATLVAELQDEGQAITLNAAIPYAGRMDTKNPEFQRLLKRCAHTTISAQHYTKHCYQIRNQQMVDQSARVIAIYDGTTPGGTASTIKYAKSQRRDLRTLTMSLTY